MHSIYIKGTEKIEISIYFRPVKSNIIEILLLSDSQLTIMIVDFPSIAELQQNQ